MSHNKLWRQFIGLLPAFLVMYALSFVFLGFLLVINATTDVSFIAFFRDPVEMLGAPAYTGLASNTGILFWSASASICIFSCFILRRQVGGEGATFLLVMGTLTVLLMLDDLFLFHEKIGVFFGSAFGISNSPGEAFIFFIYILMLTVSVIRYRKVFFGTEYILLASAIVLFGLSALFDLVPIGFWEKYFHIAEDVLKFLAIVNWFAYTARTAFKLVRVRPLVLCAGE